MYLILAARFRFVKGHDYRVVGFFIVPFNVEERSFDSSQRSSCIDALDAAPPSAREQCASTLNSTEEVEIDRFEISGRGWREGRERATEYGKERAEKWKRYARRQTDVAEARCFVWRRSLQPRIKTFEDIGAASEIVLCVSSSLVNRHYSTLGRRTNDPSRSIARRAR